VSVVTVDYKQEGDIFDIQRFSLNDGPGIRTIVFLKGCPSFMLVVQQSRITAPPPRSNV
jgi:hypothetical protein